MAAWNSAMCGVAKCAFRSSNVTHFSVMRSGIALGIDRWVMQFGGLDNIRDCIAFPKTQRATDLMSDAPGEVDTRQLTELGIKLK